MQLKKPIMCPNFILTLFKQIFSISALIVGLNICCISAHAGLTVEITQGNIDPLPTAVTSFQSSVPSLNDLGAKISTIISADLERCGLFKPLDPSSFIQTLTSLKEGPRFADWRLINAKFLIKGELTQVSATQFRIVFYLYDVITEKKLEGIALTDTFDRYRRVAHKIADMIYKRITGDEGYFNTKIAYVAQTGPITKRVKKIVLMDQDGAQPRALTSGQSLVLTPRFSPTMHEISYIDFTLRQFKVYILSLNTGQRQLVGNFKGATFAPRFSPDGQSIIMSFAAQGHTSLYVMNLRNRQVKRLTQGPQIDTSPCYSPDGTQIVFNSDREGTPQLYTMSANGEKIKRITSKKGKYLTPVWSPRGDLIAFTKIYKGTFYIGVMKKDGSNERLLAQGHVLDDPSWAPNGRVITFSRMDRRGNSKVYSIDLTGFNERVIETPTDAAGACWSPLIQ